MTKLNLLLLAAVVASGLMMIRSAYESRQLFAAIHKAENEALRLAGETQRLEAERQVQSTNLRVERTAREKLAMRTATPAVTLYVVDPLGRPASSVTMPSATATPDMTHSPAPASTAPTGMASSPVPTSEATR